MLHPGCRLPTPSSVGTQPPMGLPDRSELCRRFDAAIHRARGRSPQLTQHGQDADAPPAVCVVALRTTWRRWPTVTPRPGRRGGRAGACRLHHLVRSADLLGQLGPGGARGSLHRPLAPAVAGSLAETHHRCGGHAARGRGRSVLASSGVIVGVAFAGPGDDAAAILVRAEGARRPHRARPAHQPGRRLHPCQVGLASRAGSPAPRGRRTT